jgi:hypothetical protein
MKQLVDWRKMSAEWQKAFHGLRENSERERLSLCATIKHLQQAIYVIGCVFGFLLFVEVILVLQIDKKTTALDAAVARCRTWESAALRAQVEATRWHRREIIWKEEARDDERQLDICQGVSQGDLQPHVSRGRR